MSSRHRAPLESRVYVPAAGEASDVELMPAGDVTDGVVRVGGTIRRPHQPQSFAVAAYLDWLEDAGFDGSPRFLGRDARGPGRADVPARTVRRAASRKPGSSPRSSWSPSRSCCAGCTRPRPGLCRAPIRSRRARSGRIRRSWSAISTSPRRTWWSGTAVPPAWWTSTSPAPRRLSRIPSTPRCTGCRSGTPPTRGPAGRRRTRSGGSGSSPTPTAGTTRNGDACPRSASRPRALSYERMQHNARALGGGWARMWDDGVGDDDPPPRHLARRQRRAVAGRA